MPFRALFILLCLCGNCILSPHQLAAPFPFPWPPRTDLHFLLAVHSPHSSCSPSVVSRWRAASRGHRHPISLCSHVQHPYFKSLRAGSRLALTWYRDYCNLLPTLVISNSRTSQLSCVALAVSIVLTLQDNYFFFFFLILGPSFRPSAREVVWLHSLLCKPHTGTFLLHPTGNHPFLPE